MIKWISQNLDKVTNKRIIIRTDYNVPIIDNEIKEFYRIDKSLETIKSVLDHNPERVIIISHRGRPKGIDDSLSLKPIIPYLESKLKEKIFFAKDLSNMPEKGLILLENIRFFEGEESNDESFVKQLSILGDIYINEAFSVSHRKHASIYGLPLLLQSYGGLWLEQELINLSRIKDSIDALILGGSKLKTKLPVIKSLIGKSSKILLGGALFTPFFKAKNLEIGKTLCEDELIPLIKDLDMEKIVLPIDFVNDQGLIVKEISPNDRVMDIGPETVSLFKDILSTSRTIFWNGPLGFYEDERFRQSTIEIANFLSSLNSFRVIGGGDTLSVIEELGLINKFSFVSTGGGASLKYLSNEELPGIKALSISRQ